MISPLGEPYPKFLLDHVREQWAGVTLASIDPDICLQVDSALDYSGCNSPSRKIRQFLYIYHQSADFDHETLALLVRLLGLAGDDEAVWNELVALDFQRDCGLAREDYLDELAAMIDELEMLSVLEPDLPPAQLSA